MSKVLLIEDEKSLASTLQRVLEQEGHEVLAFTDSQQGLSAAQDGDFQVVVTDLKMPGLTGMDVIKTLRDSRPQLPVILMTGHHTTETAIEAMKFGAYDYILKPPEPDELLELIDRAAASSRLRSEPVDMGQARLSHDAIIGNSRVMQTVYKEIGRVAAMPVTVLRSWWPVPSISTAIAPTSPSSRSTVLPFPKTSWKANCSAMKPALLPMLKPGALAASSKLIKGRFFSMKLAT